MAVVSLCTFIEHYDNKTKGREKYIKKQHIPSCLEGDLQLSNKSLRLNRRDHWLRRTTWSSLYEHELYVLVSSLDLPIFRLKSLRCCWNDLTIRPFCFILVFSMCDRWILKSWIFRLVRLVGSNDCSLHKSPPPIAVFLPACVIPKSGSDSKGDWSVCVVVCARVWGLGMGL